MVCQRSPNGSRPYRPHFKVFYDESGAIGRRYRRQDEIGTPYGVTVDSDTLVDNSVTLRTRFNGPRARQYREASGEAARAFKLSAAPAYSTSGPDSYERSTIGDQQHGRRMAAPVPPRMACGRGGGWSN